MSKTAAGRDLREILRRFDEGQIDLREVALKIEAVGLSIDAEDCDAAEALKGLAIQIALRGAELEDGQPGEDDRDRLLDEVKEIADRLCGA
jgi:hypothetical protein